MESWLLIGVFLPVIPGVLRGKERLSSTLFGSSFRLYYRVKTVDTTKTEDNNLVHRFGIS